MGVSISKKIRGEEIDRIILEQLATGTKTSEELRRAIVDTKEVLYNHMGKFVKLGVVEASRPVRRSVLKKYRLVKKAGPGSPASNSPNPA